MGRYHGTASISISIYRGLISRYRCRYRYFRGAVKVLESKSIMLWYWWERGIIFGVLTSLLLMLITIVVESSWIGKMSTWHSCYKLFGLILIFSINFRTEIRWKMDEKRISIARYIEGAISRYRYWSNIAISISISIYRPSLMLIWPYKRKIKI